MEGRCNDDRRIRRRELAHRACFVYAIFMLPNGGGWHVEERGVKLPTEELAPARGEGLSPLV